MCLQCDSISQSDPALACLVLYQNGNSEKAQLEPLQQDFINQQVMSQWPCPSFIYSGTVFPSSYCVAFFVTAWPHGIPPT